MNSRDIRQSFIDFFRDRGHKPHPSAPLVPHGDPTLLFTNAGMVQFKNAFLGREEPPAPRVVTAQKCLRVSGKHNDLESVGPSPRHHTFFEMLGNFSFGDYFKEDAIRFAWELVTDAWGLPVEHLYATVFHDDDEAYDLWAKLSGLPESRILRCGEKDNFWAMGDVGPCGPCSELHIDLTPDRPAVDWEEGSESGRYLELWNLVFMQYDRDESGTLNPLPDPSIDTGAGLERLAAVLQGVESNYDTDLFVPILEAAGTVAKVPYGSSPEQDTSLRVIADHLRSVTFLLADGVIPGNEGRSYVLRRILRRAVRHGMRLGLEEPFLHRLVPVLGEVMGDAYPELAATRDASVATIRTEEEKFLSTLAAGSRQVQEEIEAARAKGLAELPGARAFWLYETHGLPVETIAEIAEEERMGFDRTGFDEALRRQQERSRQSAGEGKKRFAAMIRTVLEEGVDETRFEGYEHFALQGARVLRLAKEEGGRALAAAALGAGESGMVVLDATVFYAESGGQVADDGTITWDGRPRPGDRCPEGGGGLLAPCRGGGGDAPPGGDGRPRSRRPPCAARPSAITPPPISSTRRFATSWARGCARPARWSPRTGCASTSPSTGRSRMTSCAGSRTGSTTGCCARCRPASGRWPTTRRWPRGRWRSSARNTATGCARSRCPASAWSSAAAAT